MQENSRYVGKPLLRLLELYVLWTIGELSEKDAASLENMTPKLRSVYNSTAEWPEIVASTVQIGPEMPSHLRQMWEKNLAIAQQNHELLTPQKFAEMIVDDNFVGP